jgi:GMP synthase (glutamine-hydrolysing)
MLAVMSADDSAPLSALLVVCGEPEPAIAEPLGDYARWFRAALAPAVSLATCDARVETCDAARLRAADLVLISGSPHSVYEPLPWIARLADAVRDVVRARAVPVLGVCFGHQLMARACGGRVLANPRGREIGTIEVHQTPAARDDALLGALPNRFAVQATHCDTVVVPPPGATVLARNALDDCQAFALDGAYGVQFHPEFSADVIRGYLRVRAPRIAGEGLDPAALLAGVRETDAGVRLLARFVDLARARRHSGTKGDGSAVPPRDSPGNAA